MPTPTTSIRERARAWLAALAAFLSLALAQGGALAQTGPAYTQAELDRMLAPIALYPDPLLSQILMAATYPIEVVEAARWSRANPHLHGDEAVRAVADRDWDPSVKSLVAFPHVLARMDQNLEWLRDLGDAFLAQEPHVMETIQQLRRRAHAAGTLAPDERIRVVDDGRVIVLEPADARIVYVPYYDPRIAYGPWWWPDYPPVAWAPWPGYAAPYLHPRPGIATSLFWGPAIRVSIGFFFGAVDWHRHEVRVVRVDNYYYHRPIVRHQTRVHARVARLDAAPGRWAHDPRHRRGVAYRTPEIERRYADHGPAQAARRGGPRQEIVPPRSERRPPLARPEADRAGRARERARPEAFGPRVPAPAPTALPGVDSAPTARERGVRAAPPRPPVARPPSDRSERARDRVRSDSSGPRAQPPSAVATPNAHPAPAARERDARAAQRRPTPRPEAFAPRRAPVAGPARVEPGASSATRIDRRRDHDRPRPASPTMRMEPPRAQTGERPQRAAERRMPDRSRDAPPRRRGRDDRS